MIEMKLDLFTKRNRFPFFIQFKKHIGDVGMHSHIDFTELVIVLEGKAIHQVGNESFPIEKGDVFVMKKQSAHAYLETEDFKICNIMFDCEALFETGGDIKECEGFHALFLVEPMNEKGFKSHFRLTASKYNDIKKIITDALKEYEGNNSAKNAMIFAYFTEIAVKLSRFYEEERRKKEKAGIAAAAAYMERNFSENITGEKLLDISHYSRRHFIRLFTECYKVSPTKYLQDIRIKHASVLLLQTNQSVAQIAMNCGFNNSSFFTKVFKKRIGVTPSEYRKFGLSEF
ncbi:MAG: AraC family transcriptional regulator [bacterium]|nr:AraC family transcriptional regulator [bacterium]